MTPLVRLIKRPRPPFDAQAARRAVDLQIGGVDYCGLLLALLGNQYRHHLGKDALVIPSFAAIVQGPVWQNSFGAYRQRNPLRLMKTITLGIGRPSTCGLPLGFGKSAPRRAICTSFQLNIDVTSFCFHIVIHVATRKTMSPDTTESQGAHIISLVCEYGTTSDFLLVGFWIQKFVQIRTLRLIRRKHLTTFSEVLISGKIVRRARWRILYLAGKPFKCRTGKAWKR